MAKKEGMTYGEAACTHKGVDYPHGVELCEPGTDCIMCEDGEWREKKIDTSEMKFVE